MKTNLKVHLALFMVSLIYGATFTVAKIVMPAYVQPYAFILLRVSVATVCIYFFHRHFVKGAISDKKDLLPLLVSAIFGVAGNMLLFFKGLSITTPINASVLMLNTPIFVIVFAAIIIGEKLTWNGFFLVLPFGLNQALDIDFAHLPPLIWLCIGFITVGSTFLTYVLNAYALKHASSSLVGTYIYLQPVLATLIAVVSGKDILTTEKLLSIAIVFTGVYLASFRKA